MGKGEGQGGQAQAQKLQHGMKVFPDVPLAVVVALVEQEDDAQQKLGDAVQAMEDRAGGDAAVDGKAEA